MSPAEEVAAGEEGAIVVKAPLPRVLLQLFGVITSVFNKVGVSSAFYLTGDGGYQDADGYVYVMGRTDDVINVAGHRLSTGRIEEGVAEHNAVAECAVVGIHDAEKDKAVGLLLLKDGINALSR